jgi:hypothetical protein
VQPASVALDSAILKDAYTKRSINVVLENEMLLRSVAC